jgi:transcriptional regulator with XRE-family HTH domain
MQPGSRLREARERLGLTYRDVEKASYDLASERGRPEFVVRISRLADIENHGVTPSLYKLYSLSAIYHLDPLDVCEWYEVPLSQHFNDSGHLPAPRTHLTAPPPVVKRVPARFDPGFHPARTTFLTRMVERWDELEVSVLNGNPRYRYGYIGLEDHTMEPLLRPGSLVLVDPSLSEVRNSGWKNEYERPIYFLELHSGYRCGWCRLEQNRLFVEPHPLSCCGPGIYRHPDEVEVLGQVVGVAMRLLAR